MSRYDTFQYADNKGADQILVCSFVVRTPEDRFLHIKALLIEVLYLDKFNMTYMVYDKFLKFVD